MWQQTLITLRPRPRGFHLVTEEILDALPELRRCRVGLLYLLLQHTSASLTLNENADPAVRRDFERFSSGWRHAAKSAMNTTTKVRTTFRRISRPACWAAN